MKLEEQAWAVCAICGGEWKANYWSLMGVKKLPTICDHCDKTGEWKTWDQKRTRNVRIVRKPYAD
jgi:hypothetical protein